MLFSPPRKAGCKAFFSLLAFLWVSNTSAETLRFALFDVPPYVLPQANGEFSGPYVEWAQIIAQKLHVEARIVVVPFARVASELDQDRADITFSFATPALENIAVQLAVIDSALEVVRMSSARKISRIDQLAGLTVGRFRGGCKDLRARVGTSVKFYELNNASSAVRMLAAKRIDGLCATPEVLDYSIRQEKFEHSRFGQTIEVSRRDVWVFVNQEMPPERRHALQSAIEEMRSEKGKR